MKRHIVIILALCLPALFLLPTIGHAAVDADFVSQLVTEFHNKTHIDVSNSLLLFLIMLNYIINTKLLIQECPYTGVHMQAILG